MHRLLPVSIFALLASATPAHSTLRLIAQGSLTGSANGAGVDLSPYAGTLENGLPQNILGGTGSGLSYAGGNTFVAVPDRGPNATPYNSAVDDTVSYISRFQTVTMSLMPGGGALPFSLTPTLVNTTLLFSADPLNYGTGAGLGNRSDGTPIGSGAPVQNTSGVHYFTGRSDNFGPGTSGSPADARFDPESVRVSNDGKSVYISDEYGPYIRQFDRDTGKLIKTFALPANLDVALKSPQGAIEIAGNAVGRVANKGMEGLALTPDGRTLVGIMQAPLEQDAGNQATSKLVRIITVDVQSGQTHEYGYMLTNGSGVSDIVAVNDHQFLVDERDGKGLGDGSNAKVKQVFEIDLANATDITGLLGPAAASAAVAKSSAPVLDLVGALTATGLSAAQIPSKIEGLSFGQDVTLGGDTLHTLYVSNDNDFVPGTSGPNNFYVFGFTDADLPGYVAQAFQSAVPESSTWLMMIGGFGMIGAAMRGSRSSGKRSLRAVDERRVLRRLLPFPKARCEPPVIEAGGGAEASPG